MNLIGLSQAEVIEKTSQGLVNKTKIESSKKISHILRDNILNLFNILITPMIFILFYLDLRNEVISVGAITFLNTVIGIFQEIKAKLALEKISLIDIKKATVIRDGKEIEISIEDIVQGDFVTAKSGEPFLADGKVVSSNHMEVDESMLTGESDYINKSVNDPVLSGSFCVSGTGVYTAECIGYSSYINKMAIETKRYKKFLSPIQRKINYLIKFLIFFGLALSLLMVVQYLIEAKVNPSTADARNTVRAVSAIIMTLIPQGLVLTVTLIFLLGILRMGNKGVLIQKPNAIESMAHVNVMCMDKTGTLTQNKLALKETIVHCNDKKYVEQLLKMLAYASVEKNKTVEAIAKSVGEEKCESVDAIPFTSANKYSGLRININGELTDILIGAYENIKAMMLKDSDFTFVEEITDKNTKLGLRILVLVAKKSEINAKMRDNLNGYKLLATLIFEDEIKPEAREILDYFQKRNIALKIISGDNPETVKSIAMGLDVKGAENAISGKELAELSETDFEKAVLHNTIFARVSPQQKLEIIKTLQRNKFYVAMVGDGVNDALAIKESYLGVSMGSGARVTKDVSEIVLLNDSFEIMPGILSQGMTIIQSVKDIAKIFLFKNTYSVLLIIMTQFLSLSFPFLPQHITLVNFITITLPSIFILVFSKHGSQMDENYLKEISVYAITSGFVTSIIAIAVCFYTVMFPGSNGITQQTFIVSIIIFMGLFNFMFVYGSPKRIRDFFDWKSTLASIAFFIIFPLTLYVSVSVNVFFVLTPLNMTQWIIVLIGAAIGLIVFYITCKHNLLYRAFSEGEKN